MRAGKLLESGAKKQVYLKKQVLTLTVYTVPQAAAALGKTVVTFKRWIKEGLLPPPVLKDTTYGYKHYSQGELKLVAKVVREHEQEFDYLHTTHHQTIDKLWQALQGYRRT